MLRWTSLLAVGPSGVCFYVCCVVWCAGQSRAVEARLTSLTYDGKLSFEATK